MRLQQLPNWGNSQDTQRRPNQEEAACKGKKKLIRLNPRILKTIIRKSRTAACLMTLKVVQPEVIDTNNQTMLSIQTRNSLPPTPKDKCSLPTTRYWPFKTMMSITRQTIDYTTRQYSNNSKKIHLTKMAGTKLNAITWSIWSARWTYPIERCSIILITIILSKFNRMISGKTWSIPIGRCSRMRGHSWGFHAVAIERLQSFRRV